MMKIKDNDGDTEAKGIKADDTGENLLFADFITF